MIGGTSLRHSARAPLRCFGPVTRLELVRGNELCPLGYEPELEMHADWKI